MQNATPAGPTRRGAAQDRRCGLRALQEEAGLRDHEATLALIGLAIQERGTTFGDEVGVRLDHEQVTDAVRAVDGQTATPVIRIPLSREDTPSILQAETGTASRRAVRACPPSVDRRFQHTNRYAEVVSCSFALPVVGQRRLPGHR
jgi:hypothetical protein